MKNKSCTLLWINKFYLSLVSVALFNISTVIGQAPTDGLQLHYSFATQTAGVVPDVSGNNYHALLSGGATIGTFEGRNVLMLDNTGTNFLDMNGGDATGKSAGKLMATLDTAYTIGTYIYVNSAKDLTTSGNPVWAFSNSLDMAADANGCMFFEPKRGRVAISLTNYVGESAIQIGSPFDKGRWVHVAYTQSGQNAKLYWDGLVVASGTVTVKPSEVALAAGGTSTLYNSIGRKMYSSASEHFLSDAMISDFRIYNRSLSQMEIKHLVEAGYPAALNAAYDSLDLGDLSEVISDLTLPLTIGTNGVVVSWVSSNPEIIANNGHVTLPCPLDASVKLSATLTYVEDGVTYTLIKEFDAHVPAPIDCNWKPLIAKWDFACENVSFVNGVIKVKDVSENVFVGTLNNNAKIRSFGYSRKFYALDLGSDNGYFDMGTDIGKCMYSLSNYTIGAYFYIDPTYADLNFSGNCLWRFSNSEDISLTSDGAMYMSLKNQGNILTPSDFTAERGPKLNANADKGVWKHIAYTQDGDTGRIFLDGTEQLAVKVDLTPSEALTKIGQTGTLYNTIGYPAYSKDSFLKHALVYSFELYIGAMTETDFLDNFGLDVDGTVEALNNAMNETSFLPDPDEKKLYAEWLNFSMDEDTITGNITLPVKGLLDTTIVIQWMSSHPDLLSSTGIVNRPDYSNINVTLTAVFINGCLSLKKSFNVIVLANPATLFVNDLLLNYDFAAVNAHGNTVTDAAEKGFTGVLMKGAFVSNLLGCGGVSETVLYLPSDSAYFDMGTECGKLIYGLNDYSVSAFFMIDPAKTNFNTFGNYIYTFANSDNASLDRNGYMFGRATNLTHTVSSDYFDSGSQTTAGLTQPETGLFHHFVYTQKGNVGIIYFDGDSVTSNSEFTNIPSKTLVIPGRTGTLYNFLGKSCYSENVGLGPAMIDDFRLYSRALTKSEVRALFDYKYWLLMQTLTTCGDATIQKAVKQIRVDTSIPGLIKILDLKGNENVSIYDVLGHKIPVSNMHAIAVRSGIYIVKVDDKVVKVLVK